MGVRMGVQDLAFGIETTGMSKRLSRVNLVMPELKPPLPDLSAGIYHLRDPEVLKSAIGQILVAKQQNEARRRAAIDGRPDKARQLEEIAGAHHEEAADSVFVKTKIRISLADDAAIRELSRYPWCQHYYLVVNAALLCVANDRTSATYHLRDRDFHLTLSSDIAASRWHAE